MHSDLDIVKKTLSDGNEYFEPLITRYNNYIFSIMMRLTSGNVDFSEDLTQLSFLRALKYLNSYDQKKNFKNWLISIAVNCFKSEIKKESKYILDEVNDVAEIIYSAIHEEAQILFGSVINDNLPEGEEDEIMVTVIATGFNNDRIDEHSYKADLNHMNS